MIAPARMSEDPKDRLRELITGMDIKALAKDCGVPYHVLWYWASGRGKTLDVSHADKVLRHLTGTGIEIREEGAA